MISIFDIWLFSQEATVANLGQRGSALCPPLSQWSLLRTEPGLDVAGPDRAEDRDEHRHGEGEKLCQGRGNIWFRIARDLGSWEVESSNVLILVLGYDIANSVTVTYSNCKLND